MRVVLDTNVLVTALRNPKGASGEILRLVRHRSLTMIVSVPLFLEYEAVLKRSEQLVASRLAADDIDRILDVLAAIAEPVEIRFLWRPQLRDAADEMVLETAVNGRASTIVTFNGRHFLRAAGRFDVEIATPAELIAHLLHGRS